MSGATKPAETGNLMLRPPETVMRLARMGAAFPTRLSFMRTLIRRLAAERTNVVRTLWEIDANGVGRAVYSLELGGHTYSLVAFAHDLPADKRTDRVIAEAWDTTYVLYDGHPDEPELDRLAANAPHQEAGRFTERDLVLSRANKSVRLFEHVVESLAAGHQPSAKLIRSIGYLMRTTAVYGNGKFGIADRDCFAARPGLDGPFAAEMLTVWLIRTFTHDLVEHIARARSPETFVPLTRNIRRHLGIGNATGLGMAPFLASHPILLHNWVAARETALARVHAIKHAPPETITAALRLMGRTTQHLAEWSVDDIRQMQRIEALRTEFAELCDIAQSTDWWTAAYPWQRLTDITSNKSLETQELIAALILEPHGDLVDDLETSLTSDVTPRLNPAMRTTDLKSLIEQHCAFARDTDFSSSSETAQFWYVSEEKLEPRLGNRKTDPGADRETPLDIARRIKALYRDLTADARAQSLAAFLIRHPVHRDAALRVQTISHYPYAEIRDNLIAAACRPIDMLRFKLSFFGAAKFDPKSDLWTRITLYQGAPLTDELDPGTADDWWLPVYQSSHNAA